MFQLSNSVRLIGVLTAHIHLQTLHNGRKTAALALETLEHSTTEQATTGDATTGPRRHWYRLIAHDAIAENMQQHLGKGSHIAIHGMLSQRCFRDEHGLLKVVTEIVVRDYMRIRTTEPRKSNLIFSS